jgi:hypothetical protein
MGAPSPEGGEQPPAVQAQGMPGAMSPQMQAYLRAMAPQMMAQQMGNAAPGMAGGSGLMNGITKALLGGMTGNRMAEMNGQPSPMARLMNRFKGPGTPVQQPDMTSQQAGMANNA